MRAPMRMSEAAGEDGAACAASKCAELALDDRVGREDITETPQQSLDFQY
jgi:hypothetical protein